MTVNSFQVGDSSKPAPLPQGEGLKVPGHERVTIYLSPIEPGEKGKGYQQSVTYLVKTDVEQHIAITYQMTTTARNQELAMRVFDRDIDAQLETLERTIDQGVVALQRLPQRSVAVSYEISGKVAGEKQPLWRKITSKKTYKHLWNYLASADYRRQQRDAAAAALYRQKYDLIYQKAPTTASADRPAPATEAAPATVAAPAAESAPAAEEVAAAPALTAAQRHDDDLLYFNTWNSAFDAKEKLGENRGLRRALTSHAPYRIKGDSAGVALVKANQVSSEDKGQTLDTLVDRLQSFTPRSVQELHVVLKLLDSLNKDESYTPYLEKAAIRHRLEAIASKHLDVYKVLLARLESQQPANLDEVAAKKGALKLLEEDALLQPFVAAQQSAPRLAAIKDAIAPAAKAIRDSADAALKELEEHPKTGDEVRAKLERLAQLEQNPPAFLVGAEMAGRLGAIKEKLQTIEAAIETQRRNKERNRPIYDAIGGYSTLEDYQKGLWQLNIEVAQLAGDDGRLPDLLDGAQIVRLLSSTDGKDNVAKLLLISKFSLWAKKLDPHPLRLALLSQPPLDGRQLEQLLASAILILESHYMRDKAYTPDKNPFLDLQPFRELAAFVRAQGAAGDATLRLGAALDRELARYRLEGAAAGGAAPDDAAKAAARKDFGKFMGAAGKPPSAEALRQFVAGLRHLHVGCAKSTNMLELNMLSRIGSDTKKELDGAQFSAQDNTTLFNNISIAVANTILVGADDRQVVAAYRFFQHAMLQAVADHDYYTAFAIHSGLTQLPVERFMVGRKLDDDKALQRRFLEAAQIFDMKNNYGAFKKVARGLPQRTYLPNIIPGAMDKVLEKLPLTKEEDDGQGVSRTVVATAPLLALEDLQTQYKMSRDFPARPHPAAEGFVKGFADLFDERTRFVMARRHKEAVTLRRRRRVSG